MLAETKYARRGDVHVAYQVLGEGEIDLVFVSEWFFHLEGRPDIPSLARFLRRLSSFSRLISFDKYGIGLSDPAPPGSLPPLEEWMDDVRAVMDAAGLERAAILGAGEGGIMAATFAATHPDRTSSLILGNSAARLSWAPDYPIGLPAEQQEMLIGLVEQTWGTAEFAASNNPSLARDPSIQPEVARYMRLAASPATAAAVIRMLLQLDIRPILPSIRVPTLVMHRRDTEFLTIDNGRYLAEHIEGPRFVELPGADHGLELGDVDPVVDEIEEFVTGTRAFVDTDRVLATVLFTDIVGSTERAVALGDQRWRDILDAHDRLAERQLARYRGTLVKATGDGLLATFDVPARAIQCSLALRDGLRGLAMEIRSGLHCGEIERRGPDVGGLAVHIAARVQAVARPGEVLVTRTVKRPRSRGRDPIRRPRPSRPEGHSRRMAVVRCRAAMTSERAPVQRASGMPRDRGR